MSQQYKLPFTGKQVEEKLENTILTPITASVGQTVKISAVDANGKPTAWEAVDFSEGGTTSTYTNQLPLATDTDRTTVYDGNGYIDGYRLSSSGGISTQDGMSATGFIAATPGQTIRIKGATPMQGKNNYIIAYKADNTVSKYASMAYDSTGWITPHDGWMKYENGIIIILLTSTMFGSDFNAVRFCSAQLSDDVIVTVDEKIIDSYVQPDWNQNDSTAPDYVKNRTHWSEIKRGAIVEEQSVNINYDKTDNRYESLNVKSNIVKGNTYTVMLNGVSYECVAWEDPDYGLLLGNGSFVWNEGVGEDVPFACSFYTGDGYIGADLYAADGDYTISIEGDIEMVHTFDEKYLPKSVPLQKDMLMRGLRMVFHLSRSGMMISNVVGRDEITSNVSVTTWREFANALRNSFVCDTQTFYFSCYDMDHDEDGFPISFNLIGYEITTVDDVPTVKESGLKVIYNKEEQTVTSRKLT